MRTTAHSVLFWRTADLYSNWHPSVFVLDGVTYQNVEQYMMAAKARLFGDAQAEAKIMAASASDSRRIKALGRTVRGYDEAVWRAQREQIVFAGCLAKFEQNQGMADELHRTRERELIEASPTDLIWGIGLGENDPRAEDKTQWKGLNLQGIALMRVRETLNKRIMARLNGWPAPVEEPVSVTAPRAPVFLPTVEDANRMGRLGSPRNDRERKLFEAYMSGHCWKCGTWNEKLGCYDDMSTRVMYAVWRDRAALSVPR